jgi:uncharacterized membrane protein YhaH (DUF805 family)
MTFQESIQVCFTKYADFGGRASRSEFWWFVLFLPLAGTAATVIDDRLGTVFFIATVLPLIAAGARRLHDTGRSGWLQLFALVPVAGIIVVAVFLAQPGRETMAVQAPAGGEQQPAGAC